MSISTSNKSVSFVLVKRQTRLPMETQIRVGPKNWTIKGNKLLLEFSIFAKSICWSTWIWVLEFNSQREGRSLALQVFSFNLWYLNFHLLDQSLLSPLLTRRLYMAPISPKLNSRPIGSSILWSIESFKIKKFYLMF